MKNNPFARWVDAHPWSARAAGLAFVIGCMSMVVLA